MPYRKKFRYWIFEYPYRKDESNYLNYETGEVRKEVIEPLNNYNMLVLDQRFNQNSSVTFVNANTTRNGSFRDADVSGLLFDLNTKKIRTTYTEILNTVRSIPLKITMAIKQNWISEKPVGTTDIYFLGNIFQKTMI